MVFECSSAAALIWQQNVDGTRKRKFVGSIKVQSENLPPNK